jgi:hypothetical protein
MQKLNPHLSVDCVIFGFDGLNMRVLLIRRTLKTADGRQETDLKLPGDLIREDEDLQSAARRVLLELTGLENIYLEQLRVFDAPGRISRERDMRWLRETSGLAIERVVTVAYYSLIRIDASSDRRIKTQEAVWMELPQIQELAFDHFGILSVALDTLREKIRHKPVVFELLPGKFTLRQLQNLFEVLLGRELDNRNFRKKILKSGFLIALEEKESKVSHKPARMYMFDRRKYEKSEKEMPGLFF